MSTRDAAVLLGLYALAAFAIVSVLSSAPGKLFSDRNSVSIPLAATTEDRKQ